MENSEFNYEPTPLPPDLPPIPEIPVPQKPDIDINEY